MVRCVNRCRQSTPIGSCLTCSTMVTNAVAPYHGLHAVIQVGHLGFWFFGLRATMTDPGYFRGPAVTLEVCRVLERPRAHQCASLTACLFAETNRIFRSTLRAECTRTCFALPAWYVGSAPRCWSAAHVCVSVALTNMLA
jgi:hypothetical protein